MTISPQRRRRCRRLNAFAPILCLFALPASATVIFSVDSSADQVDSNPGDGVCRTAVNTCTLRAALMETNQLTSGGGMIAASIQLPGGTFRLSLPATGTDDETTGDLNFAGPVGEAIELTGAGSAATIIDGAQLDRVIHIEPGRVADIRNVAITGGLTPGQGGGIWNQGSLSLSDASVTGNSASSGAGIANTLVPGLPGFANLLRTRIAGNITQDGGYGGGIASDQPLTVFETTIEANVATAGAGGGIFSNNAMELTSSTVSANRASNGGGLFLTVSNAVVINATIVANEATDNGGGIYYAALDSGFATNVYNSTIAYNDANQDRDPDGTGGGVFLDNNLGDAFNLYNSIIAGNVHDDSPQASDCFGRLRTHARNRFGDADGCDIVEISGDWELLDSLDFLGQPAMNGGPTATIALLPGSNAIDAGDPVSGCRDPFSNPISFDQRGYGRDAGAACDLGAYESGASNPNDGIFVDGFDS